MHATLMVLLAIAAPAGAGCDSPTLMGLITDAEMAFAQMDADSFEDAAVEVDRIMACQVEPLTSIQCAAFHRVKALDAFFRDDEPSTILSFRASQATQPGWNLSPAIAPEGHPLRDQFEAAKGLAAGPTFELDEPATGWLTIDGLRTRGAPSERPFLFQRFSREGAVLQTEYVPPGSPVPSYPVRTETPVVQRSSVKPVLLGSGITLAVAAGGLYGGAFVARGAYDRAVEDGDPERIRAAKSTTNGLVIGGIGALGAGATLMVVGGLL